MMKIDSHKLILSTLAGMTVFFLSVASLSMWGIPDVSAQARPLRSAASLPRTMPTAIDILVDRTGVTAVSLNVVRQFNPQIRQLDANGVQLTHNGAPIPFTVNDSGDTLFFYAQVDPENSDGTAVYRLAPGRGQLMAQPDATFVRAASAAATSHGRFTYQWQPPRTQLAPPASPDAWLGQLLLAPHSWERTLPEVHSPGGVGSLTLRLWSDTEGSANPDHHIQVRLNGRLVADAYWDGAGAHTIEADIPADVLRNDGGNTLTIDLPGDTDAVGESIYLNAVEIRYNRPLALTHAQLAFETNAAAAYLPKAPDDLLLFDVTVPDAPRRLPYQPEMQGEIPLPTFGHAYVALRPTQAYTPTLRPAPHWERPLTTLAGAEYLVILPDAPGFADAIQPLLSHRQAQGLHVQTVSLAQIYSEFGYGHATPAAIRRFLETAAADWNPAPRFVLLVGDASHLSSASTAGGSLNLLPTQLVAVDNGHAASDAWFVTPDGAALPQLAIGRFPAETVDQLAAMVAKTIAFEQNAARWQQRVLFVADDDAPFDTASQQLAATLTAVGYDTHSLQVRDDEDIRLDILSAFSKGIGVVNYSGHGNAQTWGDEAVFQGSDAQMLDGSGRFPLMTAFSCANSAFSDPQVDSLSETLLRVPNGGVVAAVAPSGRLQPAQQQQIAALFYAQLAQAQHDTVGDLLLSTLTAAAADPALADAIPALPLLGDPALRLPHP